VRGAAAGAATSVSGLLPMGADDNSSLNAAQAKMLWV
jgi:hypothetical protein